MQVLRSLHDVTLKLATADTLQAALDELLTAAIGLHGADCGSVQLLDAEARGLKIVAHQGLGSAYLAAFASVGPKAETAAARALRIGETCQIEDVTEDAEYEPYRRIADETGYRAVQAIPLLARDRGVVGALTVHFRQPHVFSEHDRQIGDPLARQAADLIKVRQQQDQLAELNDRLSRQADELRTQDRRREEFLSILGHELRNPLAVIQSSAALIDQPAAMSARARTALQRQVRHMTRLLNELLDITRITHGKVRLRRHAFDLVPIVDAVVETLRPEDVAEMLGIQLETMGHEVRVALSGEAAIAVAREWSREIAFLDLSMPEMDGRELARRLRQEFPASALTLVALSGFGKHRPAAKGAFDNHLLKPITPERISELLNSIPRREQRAESP